MIKYNFKPFILDTNAYFGNVTHDNACNDDSSEYKDSFSRALFHLTRQGHHDIGTIFNKLKLHESSISSDRFTFNGTGKSLLEYLTQEDGK